MVVKIGFEEYHIPSEFDDHELIKIAKVAWFLDQPYETKRSNGWRLPIYFDRTSNVYRVFGQANYGWVWEIENLPPDGLVEFESDKLIQYASNVHSHTVRLVIKDLPYI